MLVTTGDSSSVGSGSLSQRAPSSTQCACFLRSTIYETTSSKASPGSRCGGGGCPGSNAGLGPSARWIIRLGLDRLTLAAHAPHPASGSGVHQSWCSAWSSKPVEGRLERLSVGSIPMHSRHSCSRVRCCALPRVVVVACAEPNMTVRTVRGQRRERPAPMPASQPPPKESPSTATAQP